MKSQIFLFFLVICGSHGLKQQKDGNFTPIVMWHGMGDSCCFPFSLGAIKKTLEAELNNRVYVKSLEIGGGYIRDFESGYFIHPSKQVCVPLPSSFGFDLNYFMNHDIICNYLDDACTQISNDKKLLNGFNAIGFSQGSQFLRALLQKCPKAKVKNLITLGGQHQGVYGLPNCPSLTEKTCEYIRSVLNYAAYAGWVQRMLVQASYWHDPMNENLYKSKSTFLAEINNEQKINIKYIKRLQSLENFVMVKFLNDTIVQPVDTQWFGFYKPGSDVVTIPLEESEIFTKDKLGLKQMKADGKLKFLGVEGNHLQFDKKWFVKNIVDDYLRN